MQRKLYKKTLQDVFFFSLPDLIYSKKTEGISQFCSLYAVYFI